jgi:hypothetical protein
LRSPAYLIVAKQYGLEIPQPTETKAIELPGHGGGRSGQRPGDVPEVEALVTEIQGVLQLLWIERSPLTSANIPRIREYSYPT